MTNQSHRCDKEDAVPPVAQNELQDAGRLGSNGADATETDGTKTNLLWGVRGLLGYLAFTWLSLVWVELLLARMISRSMLNALILSRSVRMTLMSDEFLALAVVVAVVATPLLVLSYLAGRALSNRAALLRVGWCVLFALVWVLLLLYAASWFTFRSTGIFLATEGLVFFATNSVQFLQHVAHMEPYLVLTAPLVVSAGALVLMWLVPKLLAQLRGWWMWMFIAGVSVLLCACVWFSVGGGMRVSGEDAGMPVLDPHVGVVYTHGELYADCRDGRTGPLLYLWADVRRRLWSEAEPLMASDDLPVTWRPIISMDEYLRSVDRKRMHRWNVIFILVESLRPDQLQVCGGRREVMPALEALARQSRVFLNHYTQSSHSNYADVCPLSSHYPLRSERTHVYQENPTYPRVLIYDVLKQLGYRTAIISSQNENWGAMLNYMQTGYLDHVFHSRTFTGPTYVPRGDAGFEAFVKGQKRSGKIDDRFTIAEAIRWIDSVKDEPFYIYMNLQSSHLPYETPADFPRRFGRDKLPFTIRFNKYPPEAAELVKDEYSNSLAYVDSQLQRLFEHLKERDLWERTVIVVSGDTGQAFFEHGFAAHANMLFNEVMQVPLVIWAPNLRPGVDSRPAQHIDVPPSVFNLLGLPPHPSFQGISLFGPDPKPNRSLYLVAQCPPAHQFAVVRGDFKLIYDVRRRRRFLLNLKFDPGETRDFSRSNPDVLKELSVRLDTWRKLQLDYYRRINLHSRWYPPALGD